MQVEHVGSLLASLGGLLVGIAAVGGTLFSFKKLSVERIKRRQAENEITFQRAALGFPDFVHEWDSIGEDLASLVDTTEIDRVLILRAWNGRLEPRWTTAVYQMRQGQQAPIAYVHFELDDDYVDRIREIVSKGFVYLVVNDMPDGVAMKDVYVSEGVTASYWSHISSIQTSDSQSTAISYVSFSTHDEAEISQKTQTLCRILTGRLKGLAAQFDMNSQV